MHILSLLSFINLILILLIIVLCNQSIAKQLTNEEFDETVGRDYYLFVKYFAPWCGHCQKLAPIWDKLESKIHSYQSSKVIICSVDCTEERELCSKESVMGYPTLKLYKAHDKNGIDYEGERDLLSLETYLRTQLTDMIVEGVDENSESKTNSADTQTLVPKPVNGLYELNDDNIEEFVSKGYHFVKFYAPWCRHCQLLAPTWDQLAESFQYDLSVKISKLDCTTNALSCKHYEIKGYPTLLWIYDGKVIDKYSGIRSHEDLKQFVSEKKTEDRDKLSLDSSEDAEQSHLILITEQNFARTIRDGLTFVKYMVPWCTRSKKLTPVWEALSQKFFGEKNIKIAKVDCAQHESLCSKQQVNGYPTLLLYKNNERIGEYLGDRTLEDLYDYVLKYTSVPKDEL